MTWWVPVYETLRTKEQSLPLALFTQMVILPSLWFTIQMSLSHTPWVVSLTFFSHYSNMIEVAQSGDTNQTIMRMEERLPLEEM